jgi:hypothetical protein
MKIISLYRNGETVDFEDLDGLAYLRKIGIDDDGLRFFTQYGPGEFEYSLQFWPLKDILADILKPGAPFKLLTPLDIGSTDDGKVFAVKHTDKVLYEYHPRDSSEQAVVYTSFEKLVRGLTKIDREEIIYLQRQLNHLGTNAPQGLDLKENGALAKALKAEIDDLRVFRRGERFYGISPKWGIYIDIQGDTVVGIEFTHQSRIKDFLKVLARNGINKKLNEIDAWIVDLVSP